MLDQIVLYTNFVNGLLLLLLLCFDLVLLMLKKLDENGVEMLSAGMYPIEQGTLSQLE